MPKGYVQIKKGQLYYQTSRSGETLVFLHGFSLDHRLFERQFEYFSEQYQVLSYDLRGFG
ncbi:MAG TPA: alpha/beta hydrolase [Candidatus Wirthbacteria bacterium]|nr:alpha/beta hydrolase [Candidatus Wirthbacteria bacterium]